jgi:hypothetical protein
MTSTGETLLDDPNVHVSTTRAIINGTTYAMANITSVRALEKRPSYVGPGICGILGALFVLGHVWFFGAVLLAGAVLWGYNLKAEYTVLVGTAGGEHAALVSRELQYVQRIVQAINDAIIARG